MKEKKSVKKNKQKMSQKTRVRLAYLLLAVISFSLFLLILLVPKDQGTIERLDEPYSSETREEAGEAPEVSEEDSPPESQEARESQEPTDSSEEPSELQKAEPEEAVKRGTLYLVIDDVGYNLGELRRFLELPIPITFAILPQLNSTAEAYREILDGGKELILHQPMEAIGEEDPGPGALFVGMEAQEIQTIVSNNLSQIPKAVGMNNHMGSRGTADPDLMENVMAALRERDLGLFYLDSRTTADSVAEYVAEAQEVPHIRRNVFLDNSSDPEKIEAALQDALEIAEQQGHVVMIGHVWSEELAAILSLWYADIEASGYDFSHLSTYFTKEAEYAGVGG